MALNWAMLNPNRTPIPLPGEMTITTIDSGVEVTITIPPEWQPPPQPPVGGSSSSSAHAAASSSSSGGGSSSGAPGAHVSTGSFQKLKASGRVWLTDQRFIFVTEQGSSFESLSAPLHSILSTNFHQPTFGSNYLSFELKPSPDGNLTEGTSVEIRFRDRAMFEFVSLMEKTRERAIYMRRQAAEDGEGLPTYTMPANASTVTMVGGVPIDNPPGYEYA
ncbi:hypothetical protein FA15DRAFT_675565 [Coprinopsis marcescibilis]|uniref:GRAM domain-containing protein n=1 Tax=Coprinopsis marcescibilis TaxID=230819 RepID=A0A5C3KDB6_COPMA|nr:hypothetical protein FA15DRAFT_675565 [Coprinopsis marcescibilis]